jgi:hypothetical protein
MSEIAPTEFPPDGHRILISTEAVGELAITQILSNLITGVKDINITSAMLLHIKDPEYKCCRHDASATSSTSCCFVGTSSCKHRRCGCSFNSSRGFDGGRRHGTSAVIMARTRSPQCGNRCVVCSACKTAGDWRLENIVDNNDEVKVAEMQSGCPTALNFDKTSSAILPQPLFSTLFEARVVDIKPANTCDARFNDELLLFGPQSSTDSPWLSSRSSPGGFTARDISDEDFTASKLLPRRPCFGHKLDLVTASPFVGNHPPGLKIQPMYFPLSFSLRNVEYMLKLG